jgi:molybdopterin-guanine dinucleotide biosynthesis protein B
MPPVGLVLAEGFRDAEVPRVEVHRRCIAREFLCARDPRVLAVVTDEPPPRGVPAFGADEVEPLADALCAALRLGPRAAAARPRKGAPAEGPLAAAPAREQRSARKRAHGRAPGKRTHGEEDEP